MAYDLKKLEALCSRVYNNTMITDEQNKISDEADIKAYCQKVFGDGSESADPSALHQFNNIVVKQADAIAKAKETQLLPLFATMASQTGNDVYSYVIPRKTKAKFKWSATGTGVDLTRVSSGEKSVAIPQTFQTGFYYEPMDMVTDSVTNFRKLVDDVAEAKVRLYIAQVQKLIQSAITAGKIPTNNVKSASGVTLANFNKVASTIARVGMGGKPVFIADTLLIDYFANQQTTAVGSTLYSDKTKDEFLNALNITQIGRTTAVNLINPFTDETNSATELPVNEGYMFSSAVGAKPFIIVEYGGMRQYTEQNPEDERIKMIIKQDASVELIYGEAIGYIKESDTSKVSL